MKMNKHKVYIDLSKNEVEHVVNCASVCYASEPKSPQVTYNRLINSGHLSMLRHATYYYIIPTKVLNGFYPQYFKATPYCDIKKVGKSYYIVVNGQWLHENKELAKKLLLDDYKAQRNDFVNKREVADMVRVTFVIETQIAISRELNRVSPNNISERSTRFVDLTKKYGVCYNEPHWWSTLSFLKRIVAKMFLKMGEWAYRYARSKRGLNLKAEDARYFLPLGTETQVAYTYSIKEWKRIVEMRYHDSTGKAHPDCKAVVKHIHDWIHEYETRNNED